ncbi:uncharacterized protein LOC129005878 [Macrosteles quadrilineatus]|uniref:uncharacterized protein LOC129005878 n=1 Tax=Macrosteles quadrilineatus TaxID=74068 RepID=UPI0023E17A6F|nr:uncharacterized protein LOC129005878 [Macrosteles quadrilineatus]
MFHKNALFINGTFLGFCGVSLCFTDLMNVIHCDIVLTSTAQWFMSKLMLIFQFVIFFCFISIVFVIISSHFAQVKVGKSFENRLTIAYKFGYVDSVSTVAIKWIYRLFPSSDKVQIFYESKSGPLGIAYGVVIPEPLTDEKKLSLLSNGYSFLRTKPISNAVYISSPAIPWLSYFGQWLILCVIYPKLYRYSKTHKLSAYPVIELYKTFSVSLIAPLSQQDIFVVPEAECLMQRSSRLDDTVDSSVAEKSMSTSYHSTRVKLSETTKLSPRLSLTPISSVKNTKLSLERSLTPLGSCYVAVGKIILKHSLTPVNNNDVTVVVRSSTPLVSNGHHVNGQH